MLWILKEKFNVDYDFVIKHYHIVRHLGFLNIQSTTNYYDLFFKNEGGVSEGGVRFRTITEKWAIWEDPLKILCIWKLKSYLVHDFAIQHDLIARHTTAANLGSWGLDQLQKNTHWCRMSYLGQFLSWNPNFWLILKLGASSSQQTHKNRTSWEGEEARFGCWKLAKLQTTKIIPVEMGVRKV